MPKEITHFLIAHNVLSQLTADSLFFDPGHRFKDMFMYGAVLPDSGFYYLKGPQSRRVQKRAVHFHRDDSSCLQPVLDCLIPFEKPAPELLALAAGICCHLMADTVFHPMVYYFSGISGQHKSATFRHRLFETALDMHVLDICQNELKRLEPKVFKRAHKWNVRQLSMVGDLFGVKGNVRLVVVTMILFNHQLAYWMFRSRKMCRMITGASRGRGSVPNQFAALFYPEKKSRDAVFFKKKIRYRDPVNGSRHNHFVDDMIKETVSQTQGLLKKIEENILSSERMTACDLMSGLPQLRPSPSLNETDFIHWYGQEDITALVFGSKKNGMI